VFDPVNQAVREALAEDLAAFEERAAETVLSYDEMVKGLKKDGRIQDFFQKIRGKGFCWYSLYSIYCPIIN